MLNWLEIVRQSICCEGVASCAQNWLEERERESREEKPVRVCVWSDKRGSRNFVSAPAGLTIININAFHRVVHCAGCWARAATIQRSTRAQLRCISSHVSGTLWCIHSIKGVFSLSLSLTFLLSSLSLSSGPVVVALNVDTIIPNRVRTLHNTPDPATGTHQWRLWGPYILILISLSLSPLYMRDTLEMSTYVYIPKKTALCMIRRRWWYREPTTGQLAV